MSISSGVAAVDTYLDAGFGEVRGMSSRFSAAIAARLLAIQSETGIAGGFAEIGTFMGRFFIAMAKALRPGERAIGVDHFEWPSPAVLDRFRANCLAHGLGAGAWEAVKRDSRGMVPADLIALAGGPPRLIHVDGEHTDAHLSSDLALAAGSLAPRGLMLLDDMLHPGYPTLALTVHRFLDARPDLRILAIIDREDIVAAAKFVIGRAEDAAFYDPALRAAFPDHVWGMTADCGSYHALVLTPAPRLAAID